VAAAASAAPAAPTRGTDPPSIATALDGLRAEVESLRRGQEQILQALRDLVSVPRPTPPENVAAASDATLDPPIATSGPRSSAPVSEVRTRRRQKTVLVVDDDEESCKEVLAALKSAQVPARCVRDGSAALAAIAADKPDVLVLELGLSGRTVGRDVINMVKATMEWVDICIVLYTRIGIEDPGDVRTIHGADEFVAKGPGSAEVLAAHIVQIFQRG
jgi:CheY-like chemotaxis protein